MNTVESAGAAGAAPVGSWGEGATEAEPHVSRAAESDGRTEATASSILFTVNGAVRPIEVAEAELPMQALRELAADLEKYAGQAAALELAALRPLASQTAAQFEEYRNELSRLMRLRVLVQDDQGEWISGTPAQVLNEDLLPQVVHQMVFDTAYEFSQRTLRRPLNSVVLTFDFRRRPV